MSKPVHKKKFGSEFLCKTRYRNTLPLPPFAPKLLALPSSYDRFIKYRATGLNETTANELILDNQWALPIDLVQMGEEDEFFSEKQQAHGNGVSATNAENGMLNETDQKLIEYAKVVSGAADRKGLAKPTKKTLPNVSWLRRTEYISSETPTGAGKGAYKNALNKKKVEVADTSREGQIAAIEKTFQRFMKKSDSSSSPEPLSEKEFLASLKHPSKPGVTAVESLPVLPDFSIWGNAYTLVTFDVDPEVTNDHRSQEQGSSALKAQRSSNALIKPMSDNVDPETWLGYYLPDAETARTINQRKRSRAQLAASGLDPDDEDEEDTKEMSFNLQRDYTYTTIPCDAFSQLVFTFREQPDSEQKTAFYNTIQSKLMLRKKRAKRYIDDDPPITGIDLTSRRMNSDELAAKRDALAAIGL
ncbi:RNA polymerase-associated factor [Haplosporangium sp. Z 767]|nr:RNA polymerase-associated factor [Haplosporangium sp. Z 11]KAF9186290.1 RNA polymerase-associated factor [Haplosporangium sp. Z 767]